jgi:hypothetical protein
MAFFAARSSCDPPPPHATGPGCLSFKTICEVSHTALSAPTLYRCPCNDEEAEMLYRYDAPEPRGRLRELVVMSTLAVVIVATLGAGWAG